MLIDTNIFIYRENEHVVPKNLQRLVVAFDMAGVHILVHPKSTDDISRDHHVERRKVILSKLGSYSFLESPPDPTTDSEFQARVGRVSTPNDNVDSAILYALYRDAVDYLVTEDKDLRKKSEKVGLGNRMLSVDQALRTFLPPRTEPRLSRPPALQKVPIHHLKVGDQFFDPLRIDYPEFEEWFKKISREGRQSFAYFREDGSLGASMILKVEDGVVDSNPPLPKKKRMKVALLKVDYTGHKIGELFVKLAVHDSIDAGCEELYLTHFVKSLRVERDRLVRSISDKIDDVEKYLIAQRIFDRIFFIYFLCHRGLVANVTNTRREKISGQALFKVLLNSDDFLGSLYRMFDCFNDQKVSVLQAGDFSFSIPFLDGGLFRISSTESKIRVKLGRSDWTNVFEFLNSYHWIIEDEIEDDENERVLTPEILGHVYERSVVEWEAKGFAQAAAEAAAGKTERKTKGVYYTPENITDYICKNSIRSYLLSRSGCSASTVDELLKYGSREDLTRFSDELANIKILDPACGSGAFLIKACEVLFQLRCSISNKLGFTVHHHQTKLKIITKNIYGVDILQGATEIAKLRLWLWLISSSGEREVEALPNIEYNIVVGNSLLGWIGEKLDVTIGSPLDGASERAFQHLMSTTDSEMKSELIESKRLLESYDLENYITAYGILHNRYKHSVGSIAGSMLSLLVGIRKSVYKSIDRSFHNMVRNKRAIRDRPASDLDLLNWKFDFGEVIKRGGFDIALGNPPYVFGGNKGIPQEQKDYFKALYSPSKGKLNLFSMFIERSLNLLRSGGILSFIVPNTLLRVTSYEDLRKFILHHSKIREIVDLEAGVFEGVTASTIVITLQKEERQQELSSNKVRILVHGMNGPATEKLQASFEDKLHIFELGSTGESANRLLAKVARDTRELGTLCKEMIFGVVITKNFEQVVSDRKRSATYKPFLEGRDIDRYRIKFANKYLRYERKLLHRPRTKEIFEAPEKLLVQRISGGNRPLKAAYDNHQYYDKESINNIILSTSDFNAKYVLALLNSNLFSWYYATKFTNASKLTVNVSKAYLQLLPVKMVTPDLQKKVVDLAEKMIQLGKELTDDEGGKAREHFEETDLKINQLIYEIYDLNAAEREFIDRSVS